MSDKRQAKYKLGDVVELKTKNGPYMTISGGQCDHSAGFLGSYNCTWFDSNHMPQRDLFIEEELISVTC